MDYDKIKKILNNEGDELVPKELDWNNVESGIIEIMDSLDQLEARVPKQSKRRWILLLLLLFTGCGGILTYSLRRGSSEQVEAAVAPAILNADATTEQDKKGSSKFDNLSVNEGIRSDIDMATSSDTASSEMKRPTGNYSHGPATQSVYLPDSANNYYVTAASDIDARATGNGYLVNTPVLVSNDRNNSGMGSDNLHASSLQKTTSDSETGVLAATNTDGVDEVMKTIPALPPRTMMPLTVKPSIVYCNDIVALESASLPKSQFKNRLVVTTGLVTWQAGYGGVSPERQPYEEDLPSLQFQASYLGTFNDTYFTMVGLQYQRLHSRLDYVSTLEDYTVTLVDTIVQVQNNLVTGEQFIVRGDVTVPVDAQRRIVHHNTTTTIQLTAGVGKSWRYKSLLADLYIGAGLASRISSNGRTIYNGDVVDYESRTNEFLNNQVFITSTIGSKLEYRLTQRIGIIAGLQWQKSFGSWSRETGVTMRPSMIAIQSGFSYSL